MGNTEIQQSVGGEIGAGDSDSAARIVQCLRREAGCLSGIVLQSIALREAEAWEAFRVRGDRDPLEEGPLWPPPPPAPAAADRFDGLGSVTA